MTFVNAFINDGWEGEVHGASTQIWLKPIGRMTDSRYNAVAVNLLEHSTYHTLGQGGWQIVDRPKMVAATQWYDRSPYELSFEGYLDKVNSNTPNAAHQSIVQGSSRTYQGSNGGSGSTYNNQKDWKFTTTSDVINAADATASVEDYCNSLEYWMDKVSGTYEPPVLQVSGPVPGTQRLWALYSVEFGEAIRDFQGGFRTQQKVKITLYEYSPPIDSVLSNYAWTPTAAYNDTVLLPYDLSGNSSNGSQQYILYTVQTGQTMQQIATLFKVSTAQILAQNNLRDTTNIVAGQILRIPRTVK